MERNRCVMTRTYDPKKILVSLGSHSVTGYAEDGFITIEPHGDGTQKKVGCDGEIVRSIDPDSSATVTISLNYGSPTVAYCQRQYDRDKANGDGTFPIMVKDLKGGLLFSAGVAWVENVPSREFGKEAPGRELVIATGEASWGGE